MTQRFNGLRMQDASTKEMTETAQVIPIQQGLTDMESKLNAAEVTKVFGTDQTKVGASQVSKGNQNTKTEGGLKMKGLTDDQFYAQKGFTALQNITHSEF